MNQKNVFMATIILTTASLITKLMGFFYRIFMVDIIGSSGMGLFQLVMPIYSLAWSITSSGFTTVISHITAQEKAKGNKSNTYRVLYQALIYSGIISLFVSCGLYFGAEIIAVDILKEPRTTLAFKFLAFAVPFMTAGSCIRGYFLGLQFPTIPATSQVLEQVVRIGAVYFLAGYFVQYGLEIACAVTIIGVALGEFVSFIYVLIRFLAYKKKFATNYEEKPTFSKIHTTKMIFSMAIPLCATRVVASLLMAVENMLIPQQLQIYGFSQTVALEKYGELTGMIMPLVFLPSACLMAVSISLVPEIAKACAVNNKEKIKKTVSATFLFTFIIGIGTASLFAVFPREICYIVYNQQELGFLLFQMAFICPFLYAQMTMQGLLNGLGEQKFLFCNHLIASVVTIGGIIFLMPIYGVLGFLISMCLSLIISMILCIDRLYKKTNVLPSLNNCFIRPLMSGIASALIIRYIVLVLEPSKLLFVVAIVLMGFLYMMFLYMLGCFSSNELGIILKNKINIKK